MLYENGEYPIWQWRGMPSKRIYRSIIKHPKITVVFYTLMCINDQKTAVYKNNW